MIMKRKFYISSRNQGLISGLFLMLAITLLVSCGSSKRVGFVQDFDKLDQVTNDGKFAIENQWALPLGSSMINLISNPNYIRFKKDSVDLFLPYFGVRHSGGGYGSEVGLRYEGIAKELKLEKDPDDKNVILQFEADQGTENLQFLIRLYPDGTTSTSVTSSQRNTISYRGNIKELREEDF